MSILDLNLFVFVSLACVATYGLKKLEKRYAKRPNLPPGPPGKPFIGNLLDLSKVEFTEKAMEWAKEYGDIVYLNILGQHYVILNTEESCIDLLEKRSAIYSDRQTTTMFHELIDANWFFAFAPYGKAWRTSRRIFQERFTEKAVREYRGVISKSTQILLLQLASSPENFYEHALHFSSGIIMDIIYGLDIKRSNEPLVEIGKRAIIGMSRGVTPGAFLVNTFTFLKYWPSWAWGGGFKKQARAWKKDFNDVMVLPYEAALRSMNENCRQSFISSWMAKISNTSKDSNRELLLKALPGTAATAFLGGFETMSAILEACILVMLLYPKVQTKAHEELNRVVGRDRLPNFSDKERLPYMHALCLELLRWHPTGPIGVPRRNAVDDEYRGMFIPKGSIVISNLCAIMKNKDVFGENIEDFEPERFMREGAGNPNTVFGFGRRNCPGRHLANDSRFLSVCSVLHLFKIGPKPGSLDEIRPEQFKWTNGAAAHPEPFECSITPRFDGALKLLA